MIKITTILLSSAMLIAGLVSASIAGNNYHGYGMKMNEMSEMDTNNDGEITFDEFSAPATERLKNGFKTLDVNDDDVISKEEWDEFLRVHGLDKSTEG